MSNQGKGTTSELCRHFFGLHLTLLCCHELVYFKYSKLHNKSNEANKANANNNNDRNI